MPPNQYLSPQGGMIMLSNLRRPELLQKLSTDKFDLVVIGGGITGAGIALDAASRGMKVALVEKHDFASGTSSRSTKLIHGGLRYLKQFEIALVREVGRERAIVHRLAPHLVVSEKMLLPLVEGGTFGKFLTSFGLMVYDVLAGVESADQRVMLSKEQALTEEPLLDPAVLKGGGLYAEYRTDDARLTVEVIKSAAQYGTTSLNYLEVTDFVYKNGVVKGVKCFDTIGKQDVEIKAKYVVSAAGPWVDKIRAKNGSLSGKHLFLSKGVHLVVPHKAFPVNHSIYFDVPDGRMIFAIPRHTVTYIGTTDTHYEGPLDHVITNQEDAQYLLDAVNNFFPTVELSMDDVQSSWAGLRPLIYEEGKSASEISRKDEIFLSPNGLISIAGGKLTGYRKMAQKVVDLVADKLKKKEKLSLESCRTDEIVLTGGEFGSDLAVDRYLEEVKSRVQPLGIDEIMAGYLVGNYGKQVDSILREFEALKDTDPALRLLKAELRYTIQHEFVYTALDFFSRRTGRLYFDIDSVQRYRDIILEELKSILSWDADRMAGEQEALQTALKEARQFPPLMQDSVKQ